MAFEYWLNGLLGLGEQKPRLTENAPAAAALEQRALAEPPQRPVGVIVIRDEILASRLRIAGYRFTVRRIGSDDRLDAAMFSQALACENLPRFAQHRLALIPLWLDDLQGDGWRQLAAPHSFFLPETPPHGSDGHDWLAGLARIRAAGAKVGVDSLAVTRYPSVMPWVDLVVIDFSAYSLPGFERQVNELRAHHPGVLLAAKGVASWAEHRFCQAMGVHYSLGSFTSEPDEEDAGARLTQSRVVIIEMLQMLRRDADLSDLVAVAKRDPALTVKLLGMANSPALGLRVPLASLDQAIIVLGLEVLYRCLSLAMFRSGNGDERDEVLLELALCRARFLELLAQERCSSEEVDALFLVGTLSLFDRLLGLPMGRVLEHMVLSAPLVQALLRREGYYGPYLQLAVALETGQVETIRRLAGELDVPLEEVDGYYAEAQAWARMAVSGS